MDETLEQYSLEKLKATAYDLLLQRDRINRLLGTIQSLIVEKQRLLEDEKENTTPGED